MWKVANGRFHSVRQVLKMCDSNKHLGMILIQPTGVSAVWSDHPAILDCRILAVGSWGRGYYFFFISREYLLFCFIFFSDKVSHSGPDWLQTHCVASDNSELLVLPFEC